MRVQTEGQESVREGSRGERLQVSLPLLFSAARVLSYSDTPSLHTQVCVCVCVYKPGGRRGADHHTAVLMTKGKWHCRGYRSPV